MSASRGEYVTDMSAYTEEQKKTLEEYIKNNVEAGLELSWYFAPVGEAG